MAIEISDWNDLDNARNDLTGDYVLVNDLDSETGGYAGIGDDFEPIGGGGNGFTGQLDGGSFEIKDLVIDKPNETFVGLFGQLGTATSVGGSVFDLTVAADVTGAGESFDEGTGVLAGTARGDTQLTNVTVEGQVSQPNGDFGAGGLAGIAREEDTELKIESCISHVDVIAGSSERVGGIVGYVFDDNDGILVTDSYATGSVEGDTFVGGLVGRNADTVTESYATGSVDGNEEVGGLVGRNVETIKESYATGSVEGNEEVGGLVGGAFGTQTDSYWDTETSGQSTSDGDATGLTTDEMQGSEAETNMDGFDFADEWFLVIQDESIDEFAPDEDGYPILQSVDEANQLEAQNITFTVAFTLSVQTNPATDISTFGATLNGELIELDEEADDADVFFEFGETVGDGQTPIQTLTEPATFDELVDELEPNTTFEFRAVAEAQDSENETFTDEGDILTFTTDEFLLSVTTNPATDVGEFTATLNGELTELDSEADDADVFFNYGESLTTNQTTAQTLTDPQAFDELLETLEPNTTFEFQAVAESEPREGDVFTDEGDILTFDTDIVTLDGTITLDETAAENADVIVNNLTQDTFEGRLSTDTNGEYSVDLPDANREDTVAVAVDFADGLERYGRLITTVLE